MRSALVVNLLTEDNLPYYYETINRVFAHDVWREWARRWTAEEMRHAIVIRDYITVTHSVDLAALEARRACSRCAAASFPIRTRRADALVYVALQELATRVSHRNTGTMLDDEAGYKVMARVAADENLHYLFYRDLVSAAIEIDPSADDDRDRAPGAHVRDARHRYPRLRRAGRRDRRHRHLRPRGAPRLRCWRPWCCATGTSKALEGLDAEAEEARAKCLAHIARVERVGKRIAERRERKSAAVDA